MEFLPLLDFLLDFAWNCSNLKNYRYTLTFLQLPVASLQYKKWKESFNLMMQWALICSFPLLSCGANRYQKGAGDESFCTCALIFSALAVCSKEKWLWDSFFVRCSFVASIEKGSNHLGIAILYKFKGLPKEKKVLLLCTIQQMPGKVGHSHRMPWDTWGQI